ncbi:Cocaine esterase [subsurface metagenome]
MIPMRDGVKLFTQVYTPREASEEYPIMLTRTPYSIGSYGADNFRSSLGPSVDFTKEGYIFVYQDVRGKFKSEGVFHHHAVYKAVKESPKDTDESSDTYDTIEWLLKNIPNHNRRVGQWGISYAGWATAMGMIDAHPALKASSPQGSPADQFIGDDYYHNGAFRLMYAFEWTSRHARISTGPTETKTKPFAYGTPDGYNFFLELGPVSNVNKKLFHNQIPTWNEFVNHGTYDEYWQSKNLLKDLKDIRHPVLNVVGWFDAEDFYGALGIYKTIEKENSDNKSILIVGPWMHGGWATSDGDKLGRLSFGSKTSHYFRKNVELPFFNYYLKDKGTLELPEALVFETGSNQWKSYEHWPPKEAKARELYFHADGRLSFTAPIEGPDNSFDSFVSDPVNPVPYTAEIRTTQGHLWMVEDQRFAARRPDVLVYETDLLSEEMTIAGPIIASLNVSTTGTDADWIVKLIDVYPADAPDNQPNRGNIRMEDFQMLLAGDVFRSKFRNSYTIPEPIVPNQVTRIEFDLLDKNHTFLKGHKIMVQVQSSWFPLIDRNPQRFVDIHKAVESDFQKAVHKLYRSKKFPSHIKLRVIN